MTLKPDNRRNTMKVFASDFDGTIYFMRREVPISDRDIETIRVFQKEGNLFGVCTGRSLTGVCAAVEGKIAFDFYILASGARILDKDQNVIEKHCINRALMEELYPILENLGKVIVQANDTVYSKYSAFPMHTMIETPDDIPGDEIFGLSCAPDDADATEAIAKMIHEKYADRLVAFVNNGIVDIVSAPCSKGYAIKVLSKYYHADMIAGIGDSFNDIPMLKSADVSFTFSDSPAEVKQAADYIVENAAIAIKWLKDR